MPFVHTFIYSVQESCPGTRIIIGYSDFPDFERKILEVTYPEVFFQKLELDKIVISTHAAKASLKTKLWHELLMKNVSIGDDAVFLDIDTIMVASPFAVFENCGDLALTRRPGKWPLNSGVIFVKKSEMTLNFFEKWNLTTESIINSKALNREAEVSNGGADQHAIIELLNLSKIIRDEDSDFCYNEAFRIEIKLLECSKYNQTESVPFDDEIKIIHFKAGWHEILLANTKYTRNRPASTSKELHNLWRGYYAKSKLKLYKAIYDESWLDDEISSAVARIQYEERGIYNSELVLVCSMLKIFGINHILESGRARGHSTIVLSEFLQTTLNSKVISIDFEKILILIFLKRDFKDTRTPF